MGVIGGLARGLAAGFAGTAALDASTRAQRAIVDADGPIDYDDSLVVVRLAQRWTPLDLDARGEIVVNQLMRFGYGSAAGVLRHLLEGRVRRPAVVLFAVMWLGEVALLRVAGVAPLPWRWRRDVLATSLAQHAVYVVATEAAYRALRADEPAART